MSKLIIGCDPDSKASGIAIYLDGKLKALDCKDILKVFAEFKHISNQYKNAELHIEDLKAISSSAFNHKKGQSQKVKNKISENVGMCKQAQSDVELIAEYFDIKIVRHEVSKMWKKDKKQFELVTKWTGRSNEDTRSAAYFGFLGLN